MKKSVASGAAAVVLGLTLAVAGGANGAGNATAIKLATVLNASEEVPAPTGYVAAARGTFTATVRRTADSRAPTRRRPRVGDFQSLARRKISNLQESE